MSARRIVEELFVADHPVLKVRTLYVLPTVPDSAPYQIREGLARSRVAAVSGQCPCGALVDYGEAGPGQVGVGEVYHERGCPADVARLAKACRRWLR